MLVFVRHFDMAQYMHVLRTQRRTNSRLSRSLAVVVIGDRTACISIPSAKTTRSTATQVKMKRDVRIIDY